LTLFENNKPNLLPRHQEFSQTHFYHVLLPNNQVSPKNNWKYVSLPWSRNNNPYYCIPQLITAIDYRSNDDSTSLGRLYDVRMEQWLFISVKKRPFYFTQKVKTTEWCWLIFWRTTFRWMKIEITSMFSTACNDIKWNIFI
jgi:hypothetical protein